MCCDVKLATAESCTGGLVASKLTEKPGASKFFAGGIIAYTREMKVNLLGVPGEVIDSRGMVSEEVALAMAQGACSITGADIGIGVTGLAGPGGDGSDVSVGTVCIAVCDTRDKTAVTATHFFNGDRKFVRMEAVKAALDMAAGRL